MLWPEAIGSVSLGSSSRAVGIGEPIHPEPVFVPRGNTVQRQRYSLAHKQFGPLDLPRLPLNLCVAFETPAKLTHLTLKRANDPASAACHQPQCPPSKLILNSRSWPK